jgi:hypothetical protein
VPSAKKSAVKPAPKKPPPKTSSAKKPVAKAKPEMSPVQKKIYSKMKRSGMSQAQALGLSAYTAKRSEVAQARRAEEERRNPTTVKSATRSPRKQTKNGKR